MIKRAVAIAVISFVAGAVAMFGYLRLAQTSSGWFALDTSSPLALSADAFLHSDIELPKIKSISGKAKFLPTTNSAEGRKLGYIVRVAVSSLDLSTVPKKYLQDKAVRIDGANATRPPIKQVYYEAKLEFILKDQDGFTLQKLTGPAELVASGKNNVLQNTVATATPASLVARTKSIAATLILERCNTCVGE